MRNLMLLAVLFFTIKASIAIYRNWQAPSQEHDKEIALNTWILFALAVLEIVMHVSRRWQ